MGFISRLFSKKHRDKKTTTPTKDSGDESLSVKRDNPTKERKAPNAPVAERPPRYSLCDNHEMYDQVQSEYQDKETWKLISEIEERVEILAKKGMTRPVLEQIVAPHQGVSHMLITRDHRIILTDYNDLEVAMTPLVKAVYLLFLRHPEGIVFKNLVDYRDELKAIYEDIRGERLDERKMQSVIDVTDPFNNSINEKCARIREAFVTRIDEHIVQNYIISGDRGESKRIPLHRDFITWK